MFLSVPTATTACVYETFNFQVFYTPKSGKTF